MVFHVINRCNWDETFCLLLIALFFLVVACYFLLVYSLFSTRGLLLSDRCSSIFVRCSLLFTHCSLIFPNSFLLLHFVHNFIKFFFFNSLLVTFFSYIILLYEYLLICKIDYHALELFYYVLFNNVCFKAGKFILKKINPVKICKFSGGDLKLKNSLKINTPIWQNLKNTYFSILFASFLK